MKPFIWLASYPKSGNTWVRAFLSSVRKHGGPIDINKLEETPQLSTRSLLDEVLGLATSDLTPEEILDARPAATAAYGLRQKQALLCKVHEAWLRNSAGLPLFPPELTQAGVYIVRDPRDVATSYARHMSISTDQAIAAMANPMTSLSGSRRRLSGKTIQPMQSWSRHVCSWLDDATPPPLLVRYEDMLADPVACGAGIARHIGWQQETAVYEQSARHSSFNELARQEASNGFIEAQRPEQRFFRNGRAGAWRDTLSSSQISRIEHDHGDVMQRLGYL